MTPSTADKLREARALIEDPERWTTGAFARNVKGDPVDHRGQAAVAWCARGIAYRVGLSPNSSLSGYGYGYLSRASHEIGQGLTAVNDCLGHDAVLKVYDRAIELAEAEA